jgi:hypothetical protein
MLEALSSSETSLLKTATRRNIPEDAILLQKLLSLVVEEWTVSNHINHICVVAVSGDTD